MTVDADVVVVGAGIVGMATARAVLRELPGLRVVVLEKESGPAQHQTGRNSGVVHSGCYYRPGTEKARLVREGRTELLDLVREHGVPLAESGKVVVATRTSELGPLAEIERRARAGGIAVRRLSGTGLQVVEPHARGIAALHVPAAAAVDYAAVTRALVEEFRSGGGELLPQAEVTSVAVAPAGLGLATTAGAVRTRWLVNCAGLQSDRVARLCGAEPGVRIVPFRGEYLALRPEAAALCRTMIYPVPDPRWPFLGVHLTRGVDGSVHAGPNAVLALGREAYHGGGTARDVLELARDPGLRRLGARYWTTGAAELVRSRSVALVARELRRMVPDVRTSDLLPAGAGIRAQALRPDGTLVDDFEFAVSSRAVHVVNAPSPAAT
ncbi:MAG: L-2-hydroxyglutarate oxidase, partial [Actinomycetes bacterium]